jgi:hypothetical protein
VNIVKVELFGLPRGEISLSNQCSRKNFPSTSETNPIVMKERAKFSENGARSAITLRATHPEISG